MSDDLTPVQRDFHWLLAELRDDIARTGSFTLSKEMLAALDGFEHKMILGMMFWSAVEKAEWDVAEFCLRQGYPVRPDEMADSGPLHEAIAFLGDRPDVIRWLLDHRAELERRNPIAFTPLMAAAARGHGGIVRVLIEAKADVNAANLIDDYETALMLATRAGHDEVVKQLVTAGANVNARDRWGVDAAQLAEHNDNAAIAEYLKAKGRSARKV